MTMVYLSQENLHALLLSCGVGGREATDAVVEATKQTAKAEVSYVDTRLLAALKTANDQAERFEREWYLRGDEIERLRAISLELDRLMLVIESAVRHSDPRNHEAVMALILANRDGLALTPNV